MVAESFRQLYYDHAIGSYEYARYLPARYTGHNSNSCEPQITVQAQTYSQNGFAIDKNKELTQHGSSLSS